MHFFFLKCVVEYQIIRNEFNVNLFLKSDL